MSQQKGDEVIELGEIGEIAIKVPEPNVPPKWKINWSTLWKPEWHYPIFTIFISLLQILLFYTVQKLTLIPLLANDPYRRHEIWRLVTSCLPHGSWHHLWANIVVQLLTGILLEKAYSWKKVSIIYFLSQIGASLFASILTPKSYSHGASGAVYGLLAAHFVVIIYNWTELGRRGCRLFCLTTFLWVAFFAGNGLPALLIKDMQAGTVAHIGGAVTGFLVSILILGSGASDGDQVWEKKMQFWSKCGLLSLLVLLVLINVAFPSLYFDTEWNTEYLVTFHRFFENRLLAVCKDSDVECKNKVKELVVEIVNVLYI